MNVHIFSTLFFKKHFYVFTEFVTILLLFYVLVFWLRDMWDLSFPAKYWILTSCTERRSLNHWTGRKSLSVSSEDRNHAYFWTPEKRAFSSVQFSCSVVSDSLRPHESQHTRPPCPSPTPEVHSDSRPWSQWCHPAISSCHPLLLLPPIPPSIRVFSNESTLRMRWPKKSQH